MKRAILLIVCALPWGGCSDCDPTERTSATSPDGAFTAIQTLDECGGATVAFYTDVYVRPAPEAKQAYTEEGILQIRGNDWVGMEWTGTRTLKLTVPPSARIMRFRPKLEELVIVLNREVVP